METFERVRPTMTLSDTLLAKWPGDVLNEGFCPFPKRLIRSIHRILRGHDAIEQLAVILSVVDFKRPGGRRPSLGYLAFTAGLTPEICKNRLKDLVDLDLLTVGGIDESLEIEIDGLVDLIRRYSSDDLGHSDADTNRKRIGASQEAPLKIRATRKSNGSPNRPSPKRSR